MSQNREVDNFVRWHSYQAICVSSAPAAGFPHQTAAQYSSDVT